MDPNPLLPVSSELPVVGVVDHRGRHSYRATSGGWAAAQFVMALEVAERFAYYGVSVNLITYLTGPLGQSNASAAAAANAWSGAASLLPLLGAFLADSYIGRYRTIVFAGLLYILGYGMLSLSTLIPSSCSDSFGCQPTTFQLVVFYVSLYLVAFAQGGDKPCGPAFGADQFDANDPEECLSRSSFFNWWYFAMSLGITTAVIVVSYLQDNVSSALGFGFPCIVVILALAFFSLGIPRYRYHVLNKESPYASFCKSLLSLATQHPNSEQAKFAKDGSMEEARGVVRLFPIWAASLMYAVVFAQLTTFFTKQAKTLDRRIGPSFQIPPAALTSLGSICIMIFIPVYDRAIVPAVRRFTKVSSGITTLQRIGAGLAVSMACMIAAAVVESKRLQTCRDHGLVDQPHATVPMSIWWMVPQYVMIGIADVFTIVGLQEFFYDQMPNSLRSLGMALYLSILGTGSLISSCLISIIEELTAGSSGGSWFNDNLNQAHLDYFYWLLAGLSGVELVVFAVVSSRYRYAHKAKVSVPR